MNESFDRRGLLVAFLGMSVAVMWLFWPVLSGGDGGLFGYGANLIVGDPQTDAIRGVWGFDHLTTSLAMGDGPWSTDRLNFPTGAELMVLPLASGLGLSVLGWMDPLVAWNASLMLLVLFSGMAIGWLAYIMTDSWPVALMAGLMLMGQPMIHHALSLIHI